MASKIIAVTTAFALFSLPVNAVCMRGLAWATDNRFAPNIGDKPRISWYHHWENPPVPQMPSKDEYVPMFWGPTKRDQWNNRLVEMNKHAPKYLMAFNEPDVRSQANMNPIDAAQLYMDQINPWSTEHGTLLGSPAIAYDLNWMNTFLNEIKKRGGHVDFICLHWYGSYTNLEGFKKYVQTAHSRFGMNIWVTELGMTSSSNPSQAQIKQFMIDAFSWMDTQVYIERASWFGAFESNKAPDAYATGKNALFNPGGSLTDLGIWYANNQRPDKRPVPSRHRLISQRASELDRAPEPEVIPIHCDDMCQLRNAQIASYEAEIAP